MEVLVDTILELQCLKYWLHFSIHDTSAIHYFLALLLDAAWVRHSMAMWAPAILLLKFLRFRSALAYAPASVTVPGSDMVGLRL